MLISRDFSGPRRIRFKSYFGFGALPNHDDIWGKNDWFHNNWDGLGKVPNFIDRWNACEALSKQIDAIKGQPEGVEVGGAEVAYGTWLVQRVRDAAYNFEFNKPFPTAGRTNDRQQSLDSALADIDRGLTGYLAKLQPMFDNAVAAIAARQAQEDRARQAAIAAKAAADEQAAQEAQAKASAAKLITTKSDTEVIAAQIDQVQATASGVVDLTAAQKEATKALAPKLAGMEYSTVAGLLTAAGVGIYFFVESRRKKKSRR